jgi:glycosyltransferase involved in cell wall biosynthesis
MGHVGQGVYTLRLIKLLLGIVGEEKLRILYPENWPIPDMGISANLFELVPGGLLKQSHPLAQLSSNWLLGRYAVNRYPEDLFLSPGPFLGPLPQRSIVVIHDVIYRHFPRYEGRFIYRKILNRLAERMAAKAWKVVTVSDFSKEDIAANTSIPAGKIVVIHNWMEESFSAEAVKADLPAIRAKYRLPERYWLYLGGYDYRKNVELLIRAYAETCKKTVCPHLVLAGKIPDQPNKPFCNIFGTIASLSNGAERILLPGFVDDSDLPGLYRGAELFIFPSLMEGFGYAPAEAIACGCPTIVSDNSSLKEIVTDPKYRFSVNNADNLESMLERIAVYPMAFNQNSNNFSSEKACNLFKNLIFKAPGEKFCAQENLPNNC